MTEGSTVGAGAELVHATREGVVGIVRLNRPEKLNAFTGDMRDRIGDAVEELGADPEVRVLIVTGAGRGFCAGADVGYLQELVESGNERDFEKLLRAGERVVTAIRQLDKPVLAAVNGPAAGGGANLALACDLRIMADTASIGQTFSRIGLHPDWGGTYFMPRLVGEATALELVWSGRMVPAEEALALGLVNRVVPTGRLWEEALAWAEDLAQASTRAWTRTWTTCSPRSSTTSSLASARRTSGVAWRPSARRPGRISRETEPVSRPRGFDVPGWRPR
jgi:2-(1,2-epoxy-1,2-dihydrophenyl)acetyl-CoA isomerase